MKFSLAQAIAALSLWALQTPGASASPAPLPRQNVDCIEAAKAIGVYNTQYSPACSVLVCLARYRHVYGSVDLPRLTTVHSTQMLQSTYGPEKAV